MRIEEENVSVLSEKFTILYTHGWKLFEICKKIDIPAEQNEIASIFRTVYTTYQFF